MDLIVKKCTVAFIVCVFELFAQSQSEPKIDWLSGPAVANLGDNLAQIQLDSEYIFANAKDTRKLMNLMGNPSDNQELGLIGTKENGLEWFVLFEYRLVGYIKDDEKGNINSKALLANISEATEKGNKEREKMGARPLHVLSWYEEPRYDDITHNLSWAILAESAGDTIVNYNTRILGRTGFTSIVLVASYQKLNSIKPKVKSLLSGFSYKQGNRYFEFVKGDKVAEYGLTALIAGGAGAAAVKFGLFKYLAGYTKAIIIGIIAVFAGMFKHIKKLFKKKENE
jgi:uncharacterized membrane-anchored protein